MSLPMPRGLRWVAAIALMLCVPLRPAVAATARPVSIQIDGAAPGQPFPHFWEQMFGSGHAILALRANYQRDMRKVRRHTEFRLVRFHGIFDREVGLFHLDAHGRPVYNFSYVDEIYDALLRQGVRPYVELSFMPPQLASRKAAMGFWYDPNIAPPKSWTLWGQLVHRFAQHLVNRYGIDEVSHWYFEVWNEPNISFWAGSPKQASYFHLYEVSARALKSVSPRLRVGGPATAQAAWIPAFIRFCATRHVPVDFVSTHVYGDDTAENVLHRHETIGRRDMVVRAVEKVHQEVQDSPMPGLPVIFSEFNATYTGTEVDVTDSPYIGPWMAHTISATDGLVKLMSYWTFSDVFEEQGVVKTPFYGGFGLIAAGGIPKAAFNDFSLLHRLGTERLANPSDSALVTRRKDGTLAIAVWNYAAAGPHGTTKTYHLDLRNVSGARHAYIWLVDRDHGSPLATWQEMGSPPYPTFAQRKVLLAAARLPPPRVEALQGVSPRLTLYLVPHALALIEVRPHPSAITANGSAR